MTTPSKVMIIRHGEKPTIKHQPPFGVTADGEQDWESLTVRGWLRAGALEALFAPSNGPPPKPALAKPSLIYASKPRDPGVVAPEDDDSSKSKRPLQTVTPLASKLKIAPNLGYGKGDEAALVKDVLAQAGAILICWQHECIYEIARNLVGTNPPERAIPSKWPGDRFDLVWVLESLSPGAGRWIFTQVPQQLLVDDKDTVIT
jgi:hypothetical protein